MTMRQIRSSFGRFLAIMAIVALGVGFFCGLRLTKTAMVHTLDEYTEEHQMYDFRLVSTLGFDETDADKVAADARVAACEGEKSADALATVAGGAAKPCRFISMPAQLDLPGLTCGRMPQTEEECLADALLYSEADLGKKVILTEENDEDTLEDFSRREFTIVGITKSVLYINYERGSTSVGSGTISSFVYVLPEAFTTDYDTALYLRLADREGEVYSSEYTACIDAAEPWVKQLAEETARARTNRIYDEAAQTLSDARVTLDEKQQELSDAKQKLADAKQELADAKQAYQDGEVKLADAKREAEQELADAQADIDSLEAQAQRMLPELLDAANAIMQMVERHALRSFDCLINLMLLPELAALEHESSAAPTNYHKYYEGSGIVRCRRGSWSYTILNNSPSFLFFQHGDFTLTVRIGASFCEHRNFVPATLAPKDGGYALHQTMTGWYYLPFAEKPATSDWWQMDNAHREKLYGPDMVFDVQVNEVENGLDIHIVNSGIDRAPLRVELAFNAGCRVENEHFMLEGNDGGGVVVKDGTLVASKGVNGISVGPCFAEHNYTAGKEGSMGRMDGCFTAYLTAYSTFDRTISLRAVPSKYDQA